MRLTTPEHGEHHITIPRHESLRLDRLHLVTLETSEGRVARRSRVTAGQRRILAALELPEPPLFSDFEVSAMAD